MGACDFETVGRGENAAKAFSSAVQDAQHEHGHGGYSGTIAEKRSYKLIAPRTGETWRDCVKRCQADEDHFSWDKWGDAGAVMVSEGVYLFFGMASS